MQLAIRNPKPEIKNEIRYARSAVADTLECSVPRILTKVWKAKNAAQFPEERHEIKWRGAYPLHP